MSRMWVSLAGTAPVAIRMPRIPSLITVPTTCAAATSTAVRQAPNRQPTVPSPTSDRTSQPRTSPSVNNAETTSVEIGWSVALCRLVLAQSSHRSRVGRGWVCSRAVPMASASVYPTATPKRSTAARLAERTGPEDRRAQGLDALAKLPVSSDHDPGPVALPAHQVDDRVVPGPGRGDHLYPVDARHPAGGALDDHDDLHGRRDPGHAVCRHPGQPGARPRGRAGPAPPPAVRNRSDHVGRVDDQQRGHARPPAAGRERRRAPAGSVTRARLPG